MKYVTHNAWKESWVTKVINSPLHHPEHGFNHIETIYVHKDVPDYNAKIIWAEREDDDINQALIWNLSACIVEIRTGLV